MISLNSSLVTRHSSLKMDYNVKLDIFEGPMDLLVHLIRKNEMDIYDIPIAVITAQYLEYLDLMKDLNINIGKGWLPTRARPMSKSRGNVVPPDEMVARYGADSARLYVLFAAPPDRDLDWQESGIEGIQRFLGRVYRFYETDWKAPSSAPLTDSARRLQRKLHQTIKRVTNDFQGRWHFK